MINLYNKLINNKNINNSVLLNMINKIINHTNNKR